MGGNSGRRSDASHLWTRRGSGIDKGTLLVHFFGHLHTRAREGSYERYSAVWEHGGRRSLLDQSGVGLAGFLPHAGGREPGEAVAWKWNQPVRLLALRIERRCCLVIAMNHTTG